MPITLTVLGHAAVLLEDGTHTVVIDPFLTGNPTAARKPGEIHAKHIILTHGHSDHLGDAVAILDSLVEARTFTEFFTAAAYPRLP